MDLNAAIGEANWIAGLLEGRRINNDLRSRIAAACFAVAQQHHNSILILLARCSPLEATSFALLRPLVESVIRGLWILHAATDDQVREYADSGTKLDMASMMKILDRNTMLNSHDGLYKNIWRTLSAYTHTGELQVQRWLKTAHIEPAYSIEEVAELIELSSLIGRLAFEAVIEISLEPRREPSKPVQPGFAD